MTKSRTMFGLWVQVPDVDDDHDEVSAVLRALADAIDAEMIDVKRWIVTTSMLDMRQTITFELGQGERWDDLG